ncbi:MULTISPECIES: endonuclease domain-containing protein [Prevotella]|uniref:endonuclease domain-containing protein n=1 Tax=Prevotella melaninogenica TaxID=28132 RepID=UPI002151B2B2|nr:MULTISPECIES: endonuclease domain-containing protein [Prevotella]
MAVNILESNMGKDVSQWYETASIDRYDLLKEYAKENRQHMTAAEKTLWSLLRRTFYGFKFRRQHPINDFIADFICLEAKLIIEVDGAYHNEPQQQVNDRVRTDILSDMGYKVIRFTNEEVLSNPKVVLRTIKEELS